MTTRLSDLTLVVALRYGNIIIYFSRFILYKLACTTGPFETIVSNERVTLVRFNCQWKNKPVKQAFPCHCFHSCFKVLKHKLLMDSYHAACVKGKVNI